MWHQEEMTKEITAPADWRFCEYFLRLGIEVDDSAQEVRQRERSSFDVSIQIGSIGFCVCSRIRGGIWPPIHLGWLLKPRTMYGLEGVVMASEF